MIKKVVVLLIFSLSLYGADRLGWLDSAKGLFEKALSVRLALPQQFDNQELQRLTEENREFLSHIVDQRNLINENQALRIQLEAKAVGSKTIQEVVPAKVVGGSFNFLTIDKGKSSDIKIGQTVIYKNILVGRVVAVSQNRARVELPTATGSKISAKTDRGAVGIVTGQGGTMILENVTISDNLEAKDLVLTSATLEEKPDGSISGFPPDLLIGVVDNVIRDARALFQQGKIRSPLDFKKLEMVFIVI